MDIIWISAFYLYALIGYYWFSWKPTDNHFLTPWDKYIPTVPIFLIPYFFATLTFFIVPFVFYIKLGWEKTKAYLITQTIATTIGYAVYFLFPTSVMRVTLTQSGFLYDVLRWLHANDRPSAAFPSGHVYHTTVISFFIWIYFPKLRPYVAVILPLVIASTVLLKQHYLPDIAGGLITAIIAILVSKYLIKLKPLNQEPL